jgi:phage shock protein PspC (stress-responsive transcriptional regulator)
MTGMRRVITVSLHGNAFQLEEDACALLGTYLEEAGRALAGDPDRQEIIADLEQAIADKCARFLGANKNVLSRAEIEQVLAEMGPVDGGMSADAAAGATGNAAGGAGAAAKPDNADASSDGGTAAGAAAGARPAPRRLYQISDGAMISGVCNGLAAYLGIDVTIVRIAAVVLAFLTGGLAVLLYIVLMFVVPYANTSEEQAAAHGLPFNARTLVVRAKQKCRQFADGMPSPPASGDRQEWRQWRREWRSGWRQARAEWRAARRDMRWQQRYGAWADGAASAAPMHYGSYVVSRVLLTVVKLALALVSVAWLLLLLSFVTTGAFFGHPLPFHAPAWVIIVLLIVCMSVVTGPLHALRYALRAPYGRYPPPAFAALNGLLGLIVLVAVIFYVAHHVPEIGAFVQRLAEAFRATVHGQAPGTIT